MTIIHIGSDHAGFELKELFLKELQKAGYETVDHGSHSTESCDYPLIAHDLCTAVENDGSFGILICGTGIGMSMVANRHKGIRAALCTTELHARMARRHNDANVLCIGARVTGSDLAVAILNSFLESSFEGGRHLRRINNINV